MNCYTKKKILVIAPWYPKENNPYEGCFFKEQCQLLSNKYDISVVALRPLANKIISKKRIKLISKEKGFFEYDFYVSLSFWGEVYEKISGLIANHYHHIEGVGLYEAKLTNRRLLNQAIYVVNELGEEYDLVYGISAQGIAPLVEKIAELLKVPYVLGEHAPFPWPGTTMSYLTKKSLENSDDFFAISNDKVRQIMLQNVKLHNITYIGNYVDENKFNICNEEHDIKTFLIVAASSFYKNLDMFIEVMSNLKEMTHKPFKVMIVGYGANKGYSNNIAEFEYKIKKSNFYDNAIMIPEMDRDKMPDIYHKADAFVMTSVQEGQPVSALEAACSGLPIFSTRCGGVEDYIDESIGRIVPIYKTKDLANCLKEYLEGQIFFNNYDIRAKIVSKFGSEKYLDTIQQAFNRLLTTKE